MRATQIKKILDDTDYIRVGGTENEKKAAEYLKELCLEFGAGYAAIEQFEVDMATVKHAVFKADGREIPCKGYRLCGNGHVEAPFCYLPNTDKAALQNAKGKIVMLDTGIGFFTYRDLLEAGVLGIITYDGNVHYDDHDIDDKELRPYVSLGEKIPAVNINAKDAFKLVKNRVKTVSIDIDQDEYKGLSQNVIAELPGRSDEWIILTAHYDSTPLSKGAYDNMSGCIGLLGVMGLLNKGAPHRYGIRFVFCGSEERGLLGSKAYTSMHENELEKAVLNINLDMIGTHMGKFISCISAEEELVSFIRYFASGRGFGVEARQGVYSSDSTPFADKGVPALSFARAATPSQATIHNRYDTKALLSAERLIGDIDFITAFTKAMADSAVCPVGREIPQKVKTQLDEYLNRKRKTL